jgi:DNA polymerase-3 subunit gamma/tau
MTSSEHVALYRKYRPTSFSDVVGQEHIVTLLTNSIKQKKISHAYLFCGGRGTGKTTVARIFASDIGCNQEDIIEIDAASNRGIDEIRELREAVRTAPFSSPYKVYIIDEAHMLTKEAANALLKTLEEPPSHVIFILATTDGDKLPETIVSRLQKVVFQNPTADVLGDRLMYVAEQEGFTLSKESALHIASHGYGSYRDALGVLEQVLRVSSKKIQDKDVIAMLGISDNNLVVSLVRDICQKDQKGLAEKINTVTPRGIVSLYDSLIEYIRQGLLLRVGADDISTIDTDTKEVLAQLAKEYPHVIASKTILYLLENKHLLTISENQSKTACIAILLSYIELL